jgi:tetratricopeptide (TPR) repeat protein
LIDSLSSTPPVRPKKRPCHRRASSLLALAALLCCPVLSYAENDDAEALYEQGRQARRAGDLHSAVNAFEQAVKISPAMGKAWFQLGLLRSRAQDWKGAIEAYQRVIDLEPDNAKAPNNLANVHFRQSNHEEAARWYAKALEINPDYLVASFHYGWVLRALGRAEQAEHWFRHCVDLTPKNDRERKTHVDCLYYVGALRFRARDYEQAASIIERFLSIHSAPHPEARYYLGMSYRQLGRIEEAQEQLGIHERLTESIRPREPIEKRPDP